MNLIDPSYAACPPSSSSIRLYPCPDMGESVLNGIVGVSRRKAPTPSEEEQAFFKSLVDYVKGVVLNALVLAVTQQEKEFVLGFLLKVTPCLRINHLSVRSPSQRPAVSSPIVSRSVPHSYGGNHPIERTGKQLSLRDHQQHPPKPGATQSIPLHLVLRSCS